MKQFIYLAVFCVFAFSACTSPFKKGDNGLEYKIISDGNGKKLAYGNYIELHLTQSYKDAKKDTLLGDTRDYMPRVEPFDSNSTPPAYLKILSNAKKGDSIVIRLLVDSAFKGAPVQQIPPFMKKGGYIYTTVKILNIFESRDQADSAVMAEMKLNGEKIYKKQLAKLDEDIQKFKPQLETDTKLISAYLDKNNIKATKTNWGTFVEIENEGTGDKISYNSIVTVNYTGKTLDSGKVFDSNVDPAFKHVEPFQVDMSQMGQSNSVILGWSDALMQLRNGAKARLYIPSSLAYGKSGSEPRIHPDANLVFEVEIKDVLSQEQAFAKANEEKKKAAEAQQRMVDSMKNASGK